jgi:hypothetical protein
MSYIQRFFSAMAASVLVILFYPIAMKQMPIDLRFVATSLVAAVIVSSVASAICAAIFKTKPILLVIASQIFSITLIAVASTYL